LRRVPRESSRVVGLPWLCQAVRPDTTSDRGHMDKKVTSTFHCVASGQVLKGLRNRGKPKPSTPPAHRQAPQMCCVPARPCGPAVGGTPKLARRENPPSEPGRSTVSNRRSAPKDSAIVLNSAGTSLQFHAGPRPCVPTFHPGLPPLRPGDHAATPGPTARTSRTLCLPCYGPLYARQNGAQHVGAN